MDNQTRNELKRQKHADDQAAIIRLRNAQIAALQAEKGRLQRELQERPDTPSEALIERAERAEGDLARYRAMHSEQIRTIVRLQENPRALTADDFGQMEAAWKAADNDMSPSDGDTLIIWKGLDWWEIGVAVPGRPLDKRLARVLHRPPTRPEGAEKVEAVLNQYWSGDINGDDLADRIVEEMNR